MQSKTDIGLTSGEIKKNAIGNQLRFSYITIAYLLFILFTNLLLFISDLQAAFLPFQLISL